MAVAVRGLIMTGAAKVFLGTAFPSSNMFADAWPVRRIIARITSLLTNLTKTAPAYLNVKFKFIPVVAFVLSSLALAPVMHNPMPRLKVLPRAPNVIVNPPPSAFDRTG